MCVSGSCKACDRLNFFKKSIEREKQNKKPVKPKRPKSKTVCESSIDYYPYEIFPEDLNALETMFGGRVLEIADGVAAIVAQRHTNLTCVTLFVDSVHFIAPTKKGDTLVFKATVNRAWNTSLEVGVSVFAENLKTKESRHVVSAYFTFVALDNQRKPTLVPKLIVNSKKQRQRYIQAGKRRKQRLLMNKGK